jgi:hypothetical protein
MTELVTLAQVNNALRLNLEALIENPSANDGDTQLDDLELKIAQATDLIVGYLKGQYDETWTVETVPGAVSAAIILAVKSLYDDLAAASMIADLDAGTGPIPALLRRRRDPALA